MPQSRHFFRLELKLKIYLKKIYYNKESDKFYLDKTWTLLQTKDISANGMFVYYTDILKDKIKKDDFLLVKFTIPIFKDDIYLVSKVVRLLEEGFAINYILIDELERDRLVNSFLKIQHEESIKKDN